MIVQGIVFFIIFSVLWHVVLTRNIWGLGAKFKDKRKAKVNTLVTALLATALYLLFMTII